jgi:hypothetical protein
VQRSHWSGVLMLVVLPAVAHAASFDWERLQRAVTEYQAAPGVETARAISKVLPTQHVSYDHSVAEKAALRAVELLLPTLLEAIRGGDRTAAGVGFDLVVVADGGLLEDIWAGLSEIIVPHPVVFLEELAPRGHVSLELLTFMGERFVDQGRGVRCVELRKRQVALSGVTNPHLASVRERCVRRLASAIRECK